MEVAPLWRDAEIFSDRQFAYVRCSACVHCQPGTQPEHACLAGVPKQGEWSIDGSICTLFVAEPDYWHGERAEVYVLEIVQSEIAELDK